MHKLAVRKSLDRKLKKLAKKDKELLVLIDKKGFLAISSG